ncbi:hypothetical protein RISK_001845 [Rhodopirellula islandica]|uniref:Uncharacterized protein n=1 Tax=Rhodopirellula islandica TaxID=595434 RepID=A0A0J1EKD8_RHOIS|nr:hypothetical protein RISK_001845 [Rhodopirellula islandica]
MFGSLSCDAVDCRSFHIRKRCRVRLNAIMCPADCDDLFS